MVDLDADGWPTRASIESVWRSVIAGIRTRESAHDWSVPWVEGDRGAGPPADVLAGTGLQYLHGLDMTANPEAPHFISHGGNGSYVLSEVEVAARLDHWLHVCSQYDADPQGFLHQARERGHRIRDPEASLRPPNRAQDDDK